MRLWKRRPPPPALTRPAAEIASRTLYSEGVAAGMAISLHLLLGEAVSGGTPYPGPLPRELDAWARAVLQRMDAGVEIAIL